MLWLLILTQLLILLVAVAVPVFLWKTRGQLLSSLYSLMTQWSTMAAQTRETAAQWSSVVDALKAAQMSTANYVAGQVTLALANTEYNLLTLIKAQIDANCPGAAREVIIQATHGNAALIYFGSGGVNSMAYGYSLTADAVRTYSSTYQNILLGNICVFSTSAGQKLGVEIMAA